MPHATGSFINHSTLLHYVCSSQALSKYITLAQESMARDAKFHFSSNFGKDIKLYFDTFNYAIRIPGIACKNFAVN